MLIQQRKYRGGDNGIILSDRQRRMYDFLVSNPVGVLSTVTPDKRPHGTVIYFTIDTHFVLRFLTKNHTRKYRNLTHNAHVMLTVFEPRTQATIQVTGSVKENAAHKTVNELAGHIMAISGGKSDAGLPPITKLDAGSYTSFELIPEQIRFAVFARPDPGRYDELFESIESFDLKE